jgi:hypothetical protein
MTIENTYDTGTVSVDSSGNVTGSGVLWDLLYQFDQISINGGALRTITEVVDSTHLKIQPWSGTATGQTYVIYYSSPLRNANGALALATNQLVKAIQGEGYYFYVDDADSEPDPAKGLDGQYARKPSTGEVWLKTGGVWVSQGFDSTLNPGNNLSDLTDADTALGNLGGTTIGKAIFKAANVAAVHTALSFGTGVGTALGVNVGTDGAPVIRGGSLGSPSSAGTMPAFTLGGNITGGGKNISGLGTLGATDITASGFLRAAGASGLKLDGNVVLDIGSSNFTRLKDPDGAQAFSVGNAASGVPYLFFDRNEVWFRLAGPGATLAKMQSNGLNILTTTATSLPTNGALTVAGGAGIGGNVYAQGWIATNGELATLATTASSSPSTGALRSSGGAGVVGDINAGGKITSQTGIGYPTGAGIGGTVTQATSKSTGVTLSKPTGQITMNGASLIGGTVVSFTLTNTFIAATDVLVLNHISGGTIGAYTINAQCGAGSATINIRNNTGGSLSEALVLQFALIKGATN